MQDRIDFSEHLPRMYRVALRVVGDPEKAQDVVQNACVNALKRFDAFDGRAQLSTWLHRITVNAAIDMIRADKRRRKRVEANSDLAGALESEHRPPGAPMEQAEKCRLAMELVESLPEDCRAAFVLTQLDGFSYDEAARIEDQPRGTIASRVFRAKKLLMAELARRQRDA